MEKWVCPECYYTSEKHFQQYHGHLVEGEHARDRVRRAQEFIKSMLTHERDAEGAIQAMSDAAWKGEGAPVDFPPNPAVSQIIVQQIFWSAMNFGHASGVESRQLLAHALDSLQREYERLGPSALPPPPPPPGHDPPDRDPKF